PRTPGLGVLPRNAVGFRPMAAAPPIVSVVAMNSERPLHVLVAGGGVAALEAMMALRSLAGDDVQITVLAPGRDFHYRPTAVAEPFTIAQSRHVALADVVADFDARLVTGALASVDAAGRCVHTRGGVRIDYDALVVPAISEEIDRLLRGAGIRFRGSSFTSVDHGALTLQPRGTVLRPQRIVALPLLEGIAIAGLPCDPHGFVPVGRDGRVLGLDGV